MIRISPAHPRSLDAVAHTIAVAFTDLPASQWLVPNGYARTPILADYFRLPIAQAMQLGTVYVNEIATAAAVWFPMREANALIAEAGDYEARLREAVGLKLYERFARFEKAQEEAHPDLGEHWYLPFIGVQPVAQRKGYGTALLRAVHDHLDEMDLPAYLEAASLQLVEFYQRFRYVPTGQPIILDGQPLLWPMVRYPGRG